MKRTVGGVLPIKGYHYYLALRMNQNMMEEIKRREKGEEWEYPNLKDPNELIASEEVLDGCKEQFFNSWCISRDNENEVVLIYNHY